jgi:N-glycosylase/DNA lyase
VSKSYYRRKYKRLREAVLALYTAAMWMPDRYVENEAELWTALRDAVGIEPGTKTILVQAQLRDEDAR